MTSPSLPTQYFSYLNKLIRKEGAVFATWQGTDWVEHDKEYILAPEFELVDEDIAINLVMLFFIVSHRSHIMEAHEYHLPPDYHLIQHGTP